MELFGDCKSCWVTVGLIGDCRGLFGDCESPTPEWSCTVPRKFKGRIRPHSPYTVLTILLTIYCIPINVHKVG